VAHRIAEKKIAREEENEADKIGLFIAAEAGYHPDFAISAARTLRSSAGELSKVGAFFTDHPRWQTREQRAERNRAEALRFFQSKWRSAEASPGGVPPTVVVFSAPSSGEKSKGDFRASIAVRNPNGIPVRVLVNATTESGAAASTLWEQTYSADTSETISVTMPEELKGKSVIQLIAEQGGKRIYQADARKLATRGSNEETESGSDPFQAELPTTRPAPPPPLPRTLKVNSDPPGARIIVNAQPAGLTPASVEVNTGSNYVLVRKDGFEDWTRDIEVKPGESIEIKAELKAIQETPNVIVVRPSKPAQ